MPDRIDAPQRQRGVDLSEEVGGSADDGGEAAGCDHRCILDGKLVFDAAYQAFYHAGGADNETGLQRPFGVFTERLLWGFDRD